MFGPMFNPLPTQSRPSKIHSHFFDTLAYHYTGEAVGEKAVAQPFSLLHRGAAAPILPIPLQPSEKDEPAHSY